MLTRVMAAVTFLTRVRWRGECSAADITRSLPLFPIVGALIGLTQIVLLHLLMSFLPPLLLSVCLTAVALWLTRALHLDGLADTADGLGGGQSREESLRIMRDPAVGAFGVAAMLVVFIARVSALSTLIERRAADPFLVLAPSLGRWTMVAIGHLLSYARAEAGLGSVASDVTRRQFALATAIALGLSLSATGRDAVASWLAAAGVTVAVGWICARRLGGFTGDTLGANSELTETAVLVVGVVMTR